MNSESLVAVEHGLEALKMHRHASILLGLVLSFSTAHAFYLPGAAPHDFEASEPVALYVNALTPMIGTADNAKLVSSDFHAV